MKKLLILIITGIVLIMTINKVRSQDTLSNEKNFRLHNTTRIMRFMCNNIKAAIVHNIDRNNLYDIYPSNKPNSPVIIWYYGGKYHIGNKEQYSFIGNKLSQLGYTVVITQQLKYPKYQFNAIVNHQLFILSAIKEIIYKYNGDSTNISLMGHSSGGHIAAYIYNKDTTIKNCILIDAYGMSLEQYYSTQTINKVNAKVRPVFSDNKYNHNIYDMSQINKRSNYLIFLGEYTYINDYSISYMNQYFNKYNSSKLYTIKNKDHIFIMLDLFNKNSAIYKKIKEIIY